MGSSARAFRSVVVSGFFKNNDSSFSCSGMVKVAADSSATNRHLTARFTASSEDLARGLQDEAPVLSSESPFAASVGLSNDGNGERLTASAGILTSGVVGGLFALVATSLLALGE